MIMATSVIKQRTIEKFIRVCAGQSEYTRASSLYAYLGSEEVEYVSRTGW